MSANIKVPIGDLAPIAMGQHGSDWIDNTAVRTGDWTVLVALADVVFTTLVSDDNTPVYVNGVVGNLNGKSLAKGLSLFGRFTAVTLASGTIIAYRT